MTFRPSYTLTKLGTYALWARDAGWTEQQIEEAVGHYLLTYESLAHFKEVMRDQTANSGHRDNA